MNKKFRFRYRLRKLYQTSVYERCACADKYSVQLLERDLGSGEAEALTQAQEKEAGFFVADEIRARTIAERRGLRLIGTVGLLARLSREKLAEDTHALVQKLRRDLKFRVTDAVVSRAIADSETL